MGVGGRILLWLNSFVVPSVVSVYVFGYVGLFVAAVSLVNTLWLDLKVRPRVEGVLKKVEKFLNMLP